VRAPIFTNVARYVEFRRQIAADQIDRVAPQTVGAEEVEALARRLIGPGFATARRRGRAERRRKGLNRDANQLIGPNICPVIKSTARPDEIIGGWRDAFLALFEGQPIGAWGSVQIAPGASALSKRITAL
jgi:hypothetical protein